MTCGTDHHLWPLVALPAHGVHQPRLDIAGTIGRVPYQSGWTGLCDLTGALLSCQPAGALWLCNGCACALLGAGVGPRPALGPDELLGTNTDTNSITVYSRTASGNTAPLRTLTGLATGINTPFFLAVTTGPTTTIGVYHPSTNTPLPAPLELGSGRRPAHRRRPKRQSVARRPCHTWRSAGGGIDRPSLVRELRRRAAVCLAASVGALRVPAAPDRRV